MKTTRSVNRDFVIASKGQYSATPSFHTSLTLPLPLTSVSPSVGAALAAPVPVTLPINPPRFRPFTPSTNLVPTASTAPLGADRLGPSLLPSVLTWNSFTFVPFQTPMGPMPELAFPVTVFERVDAVVEGAGAICISDVNIRDHSTEVYQPRDNGDHSNRCTRIGEGAEIIAAMDGCIADSGNVSINSPSSF